MIDRPRVLLLGDSIRRSYEPHVRRLLAGRAEVVGPAENGQYSLYTLKGLHRWIKALGRPHIVHWNNGIFMNWAGQQAGEGFEYHLLALGLAIPLILYGGGKFSVDQIVEKKFLNTA